MASNYTGLYGIFYKIPLEVVKVKILNKNTGNDARQGKARYYQGERVNPAYRSSKTLKLFLDIVPSSRAMRGQPKRLSRIT